MKTEQLEITEKQVSAYIRIIRIIADGIKELGAVPSGHLYATVMSIMPLEQFEHVIRTLTNAKLVRQEPGGLLIWIGPRN